MYLLSIQERYRHHAVRLEFDQQIFDQLSQMITREETPGLSDILPPIDMLLSGAPFYYQSYVIGSFGSGRHDLLSRARSTLKSTNTGTMTGLWHGLSVVSFAFAESDNSALQLFELTR
jgi:hypothetical protein